MSQGWEGRNIISDGHLILNIDKYEKWNDQKHKIGNEDIRLAFWEWLS